MHSRSLEGQRQGWFHAPEAQGVDRSNVQEQMDDYIEDREDKEELENGFLSSTHSLINEGNYGQSIEKADRIGYYVCMLDVDRRGFMIWDRVILVITIQFASRGSLLGMFFCG